MPFQIIRNDICNVKADAVVNTANPQPVIGSGTDTAIHQKAGPELLEARKKIGVIARGDAAITPAYGLEAKYVIHAVGPKWMGGLFGEEQQLRSCYERALGLALENGCQSIAFPLISTGNYGFPRDKALGIAISVFSSFLPEHELQIYLVVYDADSFRLSEKLFCSVSSYIDEHYIQEKRSIHYWDDELYAARNEGRAKRCAMEAYDREMAMPIQADAALAPSQACTSLEQILAHTDAGFTETLLKLIDERGKKDSEIYKKANISKQHFSKIRNDLHYKPKKATAVALALALELDLEQTRDLIGRAGYALTASSKFDLIVRYYIEQKNYNIVEINFVLFEHDQSLLGV